MPKLTTAYAGSGDIDQVLAASQLDQILPEDLGLVFVPERITRAQKGLKTVHSWLVGELTDAGVFPEDNLVEALLKRQAATVDEEGGPDDIALVMVFNPASGLDVSLAAEAHAAGIPVIDLPSGDYMLFDDGPDPADEVPAEEVPPWEPEVRPEDEDTQPVTTPSPGEAVEKAAAAGLAAAQAVQQRETASNPGLTVTLNIPPESLDLLAQLIVGYMQPDVTFPVELANEAEKLVEEKIATVTPIGAMGTDADPAHQPAGTTPYYYNAEAGSYRKARGKAREQERRVFLTTAQVQELVEKGMLPAS